MILMMVSVDFHRSDEIRFWPKSALPTETEKTATRRRPFSPQATLP